MIWLLAVSLGRASTDACQDVRPLGDTLQVAFVAAVGEKVEPSTWLEVVSVPQLRTFVSEHGADELRLLQGLGLVAAKGTGRRAKREYEVRVFDVDRELLCRPIIDRPGRDFSGVVVCTDRNQTALPGRGAATFTGCGYTMDTVTRERGLDVYRVQWKDADGRGFCVWPLDSFLGQP